LDSGRAAVTTDCGTVTEKASLNEVVLDWSGGDSVIFPDGEFLGLDFSAFPVEGGGTLADVESEFKEDVRAEVARILCDIAELDFRVDNGMRRDGDEVTTVKIVQSRSPQGVSQIGQGEYDPCNVQRDNEALVFGEGLAALGGPFDYDEWVLIFANVTAHEIGHTVGFNHTARHFGGDLGRSLFVELMYAHHTVDEMLREQRVLSDDGFCPDTGASARQRFEPGVLTCGGGGEPADAP